MSYLYSLKYLLSLLRRVFHAAQTILELTVAEAGLKLYSPAPVSRLLRLQVCAAMSSDILRMLELALTASEVHADTAV